MVNASLVQYLIEGVTPVTDDKIIEIATQRFDNFNKQAGGCFEFYGVAKGAHGHVMFMLNNRTGSIVECDISDLITEKAEK